MVEENMSVITKEECSSRYDNARQCEQNYLELKSIIDDISEQRRLLKQQLCGRWGGRSCRRWWEIKWNIIFMKCSPATGCKSTSAPVLLFTSIDKAVPPPTPRTPAHCRTERDRNDNPAGDWGMLVVFAT
jgi:hypothetical protein